VILREKWCEKGEESEGPFTDWTVVPPFGHNMDTLLKDLGARNDTEINTTIKTRDILDVMPRSALDHSPGTGNYKNKITYTSKHYRQHPCHNPHIMTFTTHPTNRTHWAHHGVGH
jgi:hypothetical protein